MEQQLRSVKEVYKDMEEKIGRVPRFFQDLPERSLDLEWQLFQVLQMEDSPISQKNRQLIGLGVSAALKCQYCIYFHTEFAKFFGATEEEIEDAIHSAKATAGWSTYINGVQADMNEFKEDVRNVIEYVKQQQQSGGRAGS